MDFSDKTYLSFFIFRMGIWNRKKLAYELLEVLRQVISKTRFGS